MADDASYSPSNPLIAGRFAVDASQVLADAGGGLQACLARDRKAADGKRVAIAVSRDAPPRARALRVLNDPVENLMMPLGHGIAPLPGGKGEGYFVITTPPPGPSFATLLQPWPEKALIDGVLRPVALVLNALHGRKLTHRAIRLNNVFQGTAGQPVTLGAAWAAPPAMHQPGVFESTYNAICHPAGRGEGLIVDDVYALGVLLLALWTGSVPMPNMDDATIVRWKIELGSFGALTRNNPVSGFLAELLRGMLADDPEHRLMPSQLVDLGNLRGRRVTIRPPRRSQQALLLNDVAIFDTRMLAVALLGEQKRAVQLVRNGVVTQWLRRGLSDTNLAARIEDMVRDRLVETKPTALSDPILVMRTISAIDPRMPLCWRGIALWPDALPALLAHVMALQNELMPAVEELLADDIGKTWSPIESRHERADAPSMTPHRSPAGGATALLRLLYGLNPLLPCRVPGMATSWVVRIPDLMRYLERAADHAGDCLIDQHLAAFIAARAERKFEMQANALISATAAQPPRSEELRLLQDLQTRYHPGPLPALAKWVAARLRPELNRWRNKKRREAMGARLDALAQAGILSRLMDLVEDAAARALDLAEAQRVAAELAVIDAEILAIEKGDHLRGIDAERFGHAITGGIGLCILILVAISVTL